MVKTNETEFLFFVAGDGRPWRGCLAALVAWAAITGWAASTPEAVVAGFEGRVDGLIRAEAGKPLQRAEKRPPLKPGRGNYVRGYSYSLVAFAARCFYLGEQLPAANAALVENAQHYLDNPKDVNDRDSFHWHASAVLRLVELYGPNGSRKAGLLTAATEAQVLRPIWEYARRFSRLVDADVRSSQTWHVWQSENHHSMIFTLCWHFSKLAMTRSGYRDRKYHDGATAAAHYRAWNDYFVAYARERARKGVCIEMMNNGYNATWIKGFYNFYDFGDERVKRAAGMLLDLYFAYWAQEQIDGVAGGGKSRVYFQGAFRLASGRGTAGLGWCYFGLGEKPHFGGHDVNALFSDYRPPAVVADIALDIAGRGRYEVRQRAMGLGEAARVSDRATGTTPYKLRTDLGGILRYSYCDPSFIIGTPMASARPLDDWTAISSQNRWQGVIFAGEERNAGIVPIVRAVDGRVVMNGFWTVQHKGTLMTQKLRDNKGGAEMLVWFSDRGLSEPMVVDDVVFAESAGAYAAVRVAAGGHRWLNTNLTAGWKGVWPRIAGRFLVPADEYAVVILEVMAKDEVADFANFRRRVLANKPRLADGVVTYRSVYGDELTLDSSYEAVPTVSGRAVNYAPAKVFDSPFLVADSNAGVVTIQKGKREKVLDFSQALGRE